MNVFVDFTDESQSVIRSVFSNSQDSELYPNQGEVDEADARFVAFLDSLSPPAIEVAQLERDRLLTLATLRIAPLQDAADLDDASATDEALLKQWKQYRVAVNRVDLTAEPVVWPNQPSD